MIDKKKMNFAIEEFDSAWQEFFEDKPEPKNDEEDKKQQEEFYIQIVKMGFCLYIIML